MPAGYWIIGSNLLLVKGEEILDLLLLSLVPPLAYGK